MGEKRSMSFQDTVAAGAVKTLTSKKIPLPFYVRQIQVEFALGCNGLLRVEVAVDNDAITPTDTKTNIGNNVLRTYSHSTYIRGNNAVRILDVDHVCAQVPSYIKVRAYNTDLAAQHSINAIVTIELLTHEEYDQIVS